MPKAFSEHEKKLIRARLLEAGFKQFSSHGLKKTSIEELAIAAGISKAAFYIFYKSKETLFMDVVEQAEKEFRREVLADIERPGPSPRVRLVAVFKKAFSLWKIMPILQFFTRGDYDLLAHRVPPEKIQEHLQSDREFVQEFIDRCQRAGIPIDAQPEEIDGLLHALFFTVLHEDDLGSDSLSESINILIELVAAFCLGEVKLVTQVGRQRGLIKSK
jgi:AcrR family transcriptional regulator